MYTRVSGIICQTNDCACHFSGAELAGIRNAGFNGSFVNTNGSQSGIKKFQDCKTYYNDKTIMKTEVIAIQPFLLLVESNLNCAGFCKKSPF